MDAIAQTLSEYVTFGCECCEVSYTLWFLSGGTPLLPQDPAETKGAIYRGLMQCKLCFRSKSEGATFFRCGGCSIEIYCVSANLQNSSCILTLTTTFWGTSPCRAKSARRRHGQDTNKSVSSTGGIRSKAPGSPSPRKTCAHSHPSTDHHYTPAPRRRSKSRATHLARKSSSSPSSCDPENARRASRPNTSRTAQRSSPLTRSRKTGGRRSAGSCGTHTS